MVVYCADQRSAAGPDAREQQPHFRPTDFLVASTAGAEIASEKSCNGADDGRTARCLVSGFHLDDLFQRVPLIPPAVLRDQRRGIDRDEPHLPAGAVGERDPNLLAAELCLLLR